MSSIVCRTSFVVIPSGRSAWSSSAFRAWAQSRVGATTTARLVWILASHLRPLLVHVR
jgi:hypothetical protein